LRALLRAGERAAIDAVGCMHRYFDQSLSHLFPEKGEQALPQPVAGNKINHCILSSGFL
jgi:hypothetical protein